jgi:ABC-type transporter Mla MlaB component
VRPTMKTAKRKRDQAPANEVRTAPAVVLASHCSIKDGAALKASLLARVNDAASVTVDVSGVERIDTASMQLICVFVRDRRNAGHAVEWLGASAVMHEAALLLGVNDLLALPEATGVTA